MTCFTTLHLCGNPFLQSPRARALVTDHWSSRRAFGALTTTTWPQSPAGNSSPASLPPHSPPVECEHGHAHTQTRAAPSDRPFFPNTRFPPTAPSFQLEVPPGSPAPELGGSSEPERGRQQPGVTQKIRLWAWGPCHRVWEGGRVNTERVRGDKHRDWLGCCWLTLPNRGSLPPAPSPSGPELAPGGS